MIARATILGLAMVTLACTVALLTTCGPQYESYAQYGEDLAQSTTISHSDYNAFSCTTCHATSTATIGTRIYPGAVLEGASLRPSWWGGNVLDLGTAVGICFQHFMQGQQLDLQSPTAQALDAYLTELGTQATPAEGMAVPFTIVPTIYDIDLSTGNATNGADLYSRTCYPCHGDKHTGAGHIGQATILPDDTLTEHLAEFGPGCTREVFIEKIRHGSFLAYPGVMPPFSTELLTDSNIADILVYLDTVPTTGTCP